jgi:hypothetical protein
MHDHTAPIGSKRLAQELKRLWGEPSAAECARVSRDAQMRQAAQLNDWEDEGGRTAPRGTPAAG